MEWHSERKSLGPSHRRLLKVLADASRGCNMNHLLGCGFTFETLADLVGTGLATAQLATIRTPKRIKIARITITDTGRRTLEGPPGWS
jgi:hypothetical protein